MWRQTNKSNSKIRGKTFHLYNFTVDLGSIIKNVQNGRGLADVNLIFQKRSSRKYEFSL